MGIEITKYGVLMGFDICFLIYIYIHTYIYIHIYIYINHMFKKMVSLSKYTYGYVSHLDIIQREENMGMLNFISPENSWYK
jgi:hypothetical protein